MRSAIAALSTLSCVLSGCQSLQVVDAEAQPVAGASVTLHRSSLTSQALGTTDENGRISIGWGLPAAEVVEATHGGRRGSVRSDADPLLIILREPEVVEPGAERVSRPPKGDESADSREQVLPVQIIGAQITGGRGSQWGKSIIVRTTRGADFTRAAGEGYVWMDLVWDRNATFLHALLMKGDEHGGNPEDIYRFDLPTDSRGWRESIVLRKSEVEACLGEHCRIAQIDDVSADGRRLLIEVGGVSARHRGSGVHFDNTIFIFDTETREFRPPLGG